MTYLIYIDPGHGGIDRVNRGPTGYVEADGNLRTAKYLVEALMRQVDKKGKNHFAVTLSRTSDADAPDLFNRYPKTKHHVFFSIHSNAGGGSGPEIYCTHMNPDGVKWGGMITKMIAETFDLPDRGAKVEFHYDTVNLPNCDSFQVIRNAMNQESGGEPRADYAFLVESMFHDNYKEEAYLLNDTNLKIIAEIYCKVFCTMYNLPYIPNPNAPINKKYVSSKRTYALQPNDADANDYQYNPSDVIIDGFGNAEYVAPGKNVVDDPWGGIPAFKLLNPWNNRNEKTVITEFDDESTLNENDENNELYIKIVNEVLKDPLGENKQLSQSQIDKWISTAYDLKANTTQNGLRIEQYKSVHGLPFQFTPEVDPRPKEKESSYSIYGYHYANTYLAKTPIVHMIPGRPVFMPGTSGATKDNIISGLASDFTPDEIENLTKDKRYYGFEPDTKAYYEYVNTMMQAHAVFAGIGDYRIVEGAPTLSNFNWSNFNRGSSIYAPTVSQFYTGFFGEAFAYSPEGGRRDFSISNSTGESPLAETARGFSSRAKELQFLLGGIKKDFNILEHLSSEDVEKMGIKLKDLDQKGILGGSEVGERLIRGLRIVSMGGNMLFPDIWQDSRLGNDSYTLEMHFRSPYADIISRLIYVMLPYYKLLAMAMPRSITETSFAAPFLVRAYSKGEFSVDCGMISGLNVRKYGEGSDIADDMIPMAIDVEVTIRDMYQVIHMSKFFDFNIFFNNSGFFNMLANDAGVSYYKEDVSERIRLYQQMISGNINSTWGYEAFIKGTRSRTLRGLINFFTGVNK